MGIALRLPFAAILMFPSACLSCLRRKMIVVRLLGYKWGNTNYSVQIIMYVQAGNI